MCVCMCVCVCACACVPFIKASSYQGVLIRSPPPLTQLIQMYIHVHTCVYLVNSSGDMVKDCSLVLDMNNTALSCKHMNLHIHITIYNSNTGSCMHIHSSCSASWGPQLLG